MSTHSLVLCISSVAVSLLPQTRSDTDYMSLVLLAVQHSHFRETDWSCAPRERLRLRRPPDARLMNESICEPAFKLQDTEQQSQSLSLRRTMQPRPAGWADFSKCHIVYLHKHVSRSSF